MKKLLPLSILLLIFINTLIAQIPTDGLVGQYRLDNGSYIDQTTSGHDLTEFQVLGPLTLTEDRFNVPDKAVNFTDAFLFVDNQSVFNFDTTSNFSLAAWIKIESIPADFVSIISNWEGFDIGGYFLGLNPNELRIRWNTNHGGFVESAPIPLESWTHIVVSYDGSEAKLYIDGQFTGSEVYNQNILPSNLSFAIGSQPNNPAITIFPGAIDDVLVYDRSITEDEINQIFTTLSIEDINEFSLQIIISPNPTQDVINIDYNRRLGTITSYDLFDVTGRKITSQVIKPLNNILDLSSLSTGTYFIKLKTIGGAIITKKVIKQ